MVSLDRLQLICAAPRLCFLGWHVLGDIASEAESVAVQSKEGVQCFTDGCTGQVKLAQELEEEAGIDTHRRELLRLPDQAKKAERAPPPPQEQPEQRRGRKKGPAQRPVEPG